MELATLNKKFYYRFTLVLFMVGCTTQQTKDDVILVDIELCNLKGDFAYLQTLKKPFRVATEKEALTAQSNDIMVMSDSSDEKYDVLTQQTKKKILTVISETELVGDFITKALIAQSYFRLSCEAQTKGNQVRPLNQISQSNFYECLNKNGTSDNLEVCMQTYVENP